MRFRRYSRGVLVSLGCLGMLLPSGVGAEPREFNPQSTRQQLPRVLDVTLDGKGTLHGIAFNQLALPDPGRAVVLVQNGRLLGQTTSDTNGRFAFHAMRGGVYQVGTEDGQVVCRAWTHRAAPPQARPAVMIVSQDGTARGQHPIDELFIFHPALMGAMLAAAIAIPIAIHNSGDDRPSGS